MNASALAAVSGREIRMTSGSTIDAPVLAVVPTVRLRFAVACCPRGQVVYAREAGTPRPCPPPREPAT